MAAASGLKGYAQTSDFTCGPAVLMTALSLLMPGYQPSRTEEFTLWREANTVFMGAGHPGCGIYGLALAAYSRGLRPRLWADRRTGLFTDTAQNEEQAVVMALLEEADLARAAALSLTCDCRSFTAQDLHSALGAAGLAIVLVREEKGTDLHWVLLAGAADAAGALLLFDPWQNNDFKVVSLTELEGRLTPGGRQAALLF